MKANTAICFILAGVALIAQVWRIPVPGRMRWVARVLAVVVLLTAVLTLSEILFGWNTGLDQFLFTETASEAGASFPGRMSPASAMNFALLGTALLCLDHRGRSVRHSTAQYLAVAAAMITLLAFIAYFYGVETPSHITPYAAIALHTVLAFGLLCVGILLARPEEGMVAIFCSDRLGGILARRLLPAAILLPVLAGWIRVMGQRKGYYGLGFGAALFATTLVILFAALITWAAQALNRIDAERRRAEAVLLDSQRQLRALAARLEAVREEERTCVAREIHDVLAQELTRLKMDITWLDRRLAETGNEVKSGFIHEKLASMVQVTNSAISSVQKIATDLRPVVLDTLGLPAAIEWQVKDFESHSGTRCLLDLPETDVLPDRERSTALFRILQESLTNIARHAAATEVHVRLGITPAEASLTITDNGRGIKPAELNDARSVGLLGMRERASLLGGHCQIASNDGEGTRVRVSVPLNPDHLTTAQA